MRAVVVAAYLIAAALQPVSARPIRLVFVEPAGETFTIAEQQRVREGVEGAIQWWHDLAPAHPDLTIVSTEVLTTGADVYHGWGWAQPYLIDNNPAITLFVIDNSASGYLIFDDSAGETQNYYNLITVVLNPMLDADSFSAATAHEFGHLLYSLPHQHGATTIDIMQNWLTAYKTHFVGCESLRRLGTPCAYSWLPLVLR